MERKNCWECKNCGREPGGRNVNELGICPAAVADAFDGVNGGRNAGRYCWAVAGTLCKGEIQGVFARKFRSCLTCSFYLEVERDEGSTFTLLREDFCI
jgi:eukaryotic-like serine/threonine-protein kinase